MRIHLLRKYGLRIVLGFLILGSLSVPSAAGERQRNRIKQEAQIDTAVFIRNVTQLDEVIVKPRKEKYSKKNNPAVDLMQRVRNAAKDTDPFLQPYYSYDRYDKLQLGLIDFEERFGKVKGRNAFLKEYIDTTAYTGRPYLNLSLKETAATVLWRDNPRSRKEVTTGYRSVGIDRSFDQDNIRRILDDALREIDVYGNDITLMQNRFVSPLGKIAADYYRYHITDTLNVRGERCVELSFAPKSPESLSFNGKIYVASPDSLPYVRSLRMRVPRMTNLNFIDNVYVSQEFELDKEGKRRKVIDDVVLDLQLVEGTPSFYARRISSYDNFSTEPRMDMQEYYDRMAHKITLTSAEMLSEEEWDSLRKFSLTTQERKMDSLLDRLRESPVFYWGEKVIRTLTKGYVGCNPHGKSKFDVGPVNTMVSFGDVEGVRLRFGGMTTAELSQRWFARGYVAYGTKDHKWKYRGEVEYSFIDKKNHSREFPMKSIRLSHSYDLDRIGEHYLFTNPDNIFLSLKRKSPILDTYRHLTQLEYTLELDNNFSMVAGLKHEIQEATRWIPFIRKDGVRASHYSQSSIFLQLRYAPGEVFSQAASYRAPINMDAPVFLLTQEYGPNGIFGAPTPINKTELSVSKRVWFSSFGYLDTLLKGGIVWSGSQFPSLLWPNANMSYTIQPESFSLLNPMEFANDKYLSLDMTYWGMGILFNRIPLVKQLKFREVIGFKLLKGGLSRKNNPSFNDELYLFPNEARCSIMGKVPYMEISTGIDNVLRVLRIDYIWRLSYRHTPGAPDSGLRISLHFSF